MHGSFLLWLYHRVFTMEVLVCLTPMPRRINDNLGVLIPNFLLGAKNAPGPTPVQGQKAVPSQK